MIPMPVIQRIIAHPAAWIGMGVVCTLLDRWSGPSIHFPIAYAIPVALAAWHRGLGWALTLSALFALVRVTLFPLDPASDGWGILATNAVIRASVLMALAWLVRRTALLTQQVHHLEGLLPICAWCKRIRDDHGTWVPLEVVVSQQTDVAFTHGICPDCQGQFRAGAGPQTP